MGTKEENDRYREELEALRLLIRHGWNGVLINGVFYLGPRDGFELGEKIQTAARENAP